MEIILINKIIKMNLTIYIFIYILIKTDKKIVELKMQEEEVTNLKYVSILELKDLINNSKELAFSNFEYISKLIEKSLY